MFGAENFFTWVITYGGNDVGNQKFFGAPMTPLGGAQKQIFVYLPIIEHIWG